MVKNKRLIISLIFVILLTSFVSAGFNVTSYDVTKKVYSPQNYLEAWIQINLDNEASTSIFETSVGDSIELLKLLNLNNAVKTCLPIDCNSSFTSEGNGATSLSFELEPGKSKVVGIKVTGIVNSIDNVNFSVQSDAGASCSNQLEIDFLSDGTIEKGNDKTSLEVCGSSKNYGCFDPMGEFEKPTVEETPYCQKMNLTEAAGFNVGAWVKKSGSKTLEMMIFDESGTEKAKCDLPDSTEVGGEVSCNVNYTVMKSEEHYICIKSKSGDTTHQIKSNSNAPVKCGFFGTPIKAATISYHIFAQARKFDAIENIIINDLINGVSTGSSFETYLINKYDSDCTGDGCVVPIKFTSGYNEDQTITLTNLDAKYRKSGANIELNKFYELVESPAKVNASSQKLFLAGAEFDVTKNMTAYGNKTFWLKLNGKEVFSKNIFIEKVSTIESVSPLYAGAADPTDFVISVNEKNNSQVINYKWDFGDGTNITTLINTTSHTYNEIKNYTLKVTITTQNNFESSKTFNITVGSPQNIVNNQIDVKLGYIVNLTSDVEVLSGFYKESVKSILDLNASKTKLNGLRVGYDNATKDEDYIVLMKELVKLNIPKSVFLEDKIDSPYYPLETNIDMDVLQTIGAGSYDSNLKSAYESAVNDWVIGNLDINIVNKNVVGDYEQEGKRDILKIFEMDVDEIPSGDYYMVFVNLEDLDFDKSYSEQSGESYIYIKSNKDESIIFSTTSDVDMINLPVFMAPALSRLNVVAPGVCVKDDVCDKDSGENWKNCSDCSFSWTFIWVIGLILAIGVVIYIILQILYKKKYEGHLFKNKNSLYNLVQYVHGAKQRGVEGKKVRTKLKKAGWSGEQVRYAMRTYKGKETGMWNPFKKKKSNTPKDTKNHRKV